MGSKRMLLAGKERRGFFRLFLVTCRQEYREERQALEQHSLLPPPEQLNIAEQPNVAHQFIFHLPRQLRSVCAGQEFLKGRFKRVE